VRRSTERKSLEKMIESRDFVVVELRASWKGEKVSCEGRKKERWMEVAYLQHFPQHPLLHLRIVNPHRSTSDLHPIQHEIVVLSSDLGKGRKKQRGRERESARDGVLELSFFSARERFRTSSLTFSTLPALRSMRSSHTGAVKG